MARRVGNSSSTHS